MSAATSFRDDTAELISELNPTMELLAAHFISDLRQAGIPAVVISGARSSLVNADAGGAPQSWHLSGGAIDISIVLGGRHVPRAAIPAWWWERLGRYAESRYGLRWGGRFQAPDVNHFDLGLKT